MISHFTLHRSSAYFWMRTFSFQYIYSTKLYRATLCFVFLWRFVDIHTKQFQTTFYMRKEQCPDRTRVSQPPHLAVRIINRTDYLSWTLIHRTDCHEYTNKLVINKFHDLIGFQTTQILNIVNDVVISLWTSLRKMF